MGAFKRVDDGQAEAPNGGHRPEVYGYYGRRCAKCGAVKGPMGEGWLDAKGYEVKVCQSR